MKNKVVMIIPYFGKLPNYFNLWRKSAEFNRDFDFLFITDIDILESDNIKVVRTNFQSLKERIKNKLSMQITLNSPYKLCDFKPAYGYIFENEIRDYDFWGFCDIDLIFGNISHFITDDLLEKNDKLFFLGHFCLMRNIRQINELFFKKFKNVMEYKYAFNTNYSCHFDENGTIAWAPDFDKSIRFYSDWCFGDPNWQELQFLDSRHIEYGALYKNGELFLDYKDGKKREVMYLHFQKRAMKVSKCGDGDSFAMLRDLIIGDLEEYRKLLNIGPTKEDIEKFRLLKKKQRGNIVKRIVNGSLKNALYMRKNRILTK